MFKKKSWKLKRKENHVVHHLCFLTLNRIFHSSTSSQSHSPYLIPIGKGKNAWREKMKRKEGRNEWRWEGRKRVEGKSVTRLFLVVLVVTGGEKCRNVSLFHPSPLQSALILTSSPLPPKNPQNHRSTKILLKEQKLCVPKTSEEKSPKYL